MIYNLSEYGYSNNFFYESNKYLDSSRKVEKIISKYNHGSLSHYQRGIYVYVLGSIELPKQGWKIHISATNNNALEILNNVVPFLIDNMIPFKVIRNIKTYILLSQKPFPRSQYGKFITVYPSSPAHCVELLKKLYIILKDYEGPRILTDRRYKSCKVLYYRYGGIQPQVKYDNLGRMHTYISDGNGNRVEDHRRPYFELPKGIKDILGEVPDSNSYLFEKYDVEKAIRFTNAGGIYLALEKISNKQVIIKEARPWTVLTGNGKDAVAYRKGETAILQKLAPSGCIPKVIDSFFEEEHFFLVEEYIDGESLYDFSMRKNPILRLGPGSEVSEYIMQLLSYSEQLCDFIDYVHSQGYILQDLTSDNIMIDKQNQIKLIDLEGCIPLNAQRHFMGKTFFDMLSITDYPDFCELGLLLFSCIIQKDSLIALKKDTIQVFMNHIQKYYTIPQDLIDFLNMMVNSTHHPSICEIKEIIHRIEQQVSTGAIKRLSTPVQRSISNYRTLIYQTIQSIISLKGCIQGWVYPITPILENEYNISCGFVGIAKALNLLGYTGMNVECLRFCRNIPCNNPSGLYVGTSGCVWTLLEQGEVVAAEKLLNVHGLSLPDDGDYSIYSGKAGIGLTYIMMFYSTGKQQYLDIATEFGNHMLSHYSPELNKYIGYKEGNAGIALFLLHLSLATKQHQYIAFGRKLLDIELNHMVKENDSVHICFPAIIGGKTVYPYFMEGTAGIISVVLRYAYVYNDLELFRKASEMADGIHYCYSFSSTLYYGMAGIGNVFLDCSHYLHNTKYTVWAQEMAEGCLCHRIQHPDYGTLFPDIYNKKISIDFGNGALGVLLFLNRMESKNEANFALPLDNIFQKAGVSLKIV